MFCGKTAGAFALGPLRVGCIRSGWLAVGGTSEWETRPPAYVCWSREDTRNASYRKFRLAIDSNFITYHISKRSPGSGWCYLWPSWLRSVEKGRILFQLR